MQVRTEVINTLDQGRCEANNFFLQGELDRIKQPYIMNKIRKKQQAKPRFSAAPQ